ncbi:hypothetical protein DRQ18_03300 [bacterium]|nr:MAG: hypothetical protein DRQ18_03300 [bacterium]
MMKKWILLPLLLLLGVEGETPPCYLSYYYGDVSLREPPKDWEKAVLDAPVNEGEWLKTEEESRAEITIADGSVIRIDENTTLVIEGLDVIGDPVVRFRAVVPRGRIWANVKKLMKGSVFNIRTPIVVAGVRGTVYRMDAMPDSSVLLRVYAGEVAVSNKPMWQLKPQKGELREIPGPQEVEGPHEVSLEEWIVIVKAQQELWVSRKGKYRLGKFDIQQDLKDEWVKWNMERDRMRR